MLKGTRDGILKKVQPVSIHGQVSWDVYFTDVEDPDGQVNVARIGPEAVIGNKPRARRPHPGRVRGRRAGESNAGLAYFLSTLTAFSSIRRRGDSPSRGVASIASTVSMPSTTRANAVY